MTTQWTKEMEERFLYLAGAEALGSLSAEEFRELDDLTERRNFLKCPETTEEIRAREERNDALEKLLANLCKHVKFIDP
jgi:hypothetical protein